MNDKPEFPKSVAPSAQTPGAGINITRRAFTKGGVAVTLLGSLLSAQESPYLKRGAKRKLPHQYAGFNTPVMWDIPFEDPKFRPLVRGLRPALLRFPGGTISNYWNWRTGRVQTGPGMFGTFAVGAQQALELHPQGASFEDFCDFANAVGAEVIFVPNLETSTLEDQAAWLKHLSDAGVAPTRVELGNEFYFEAMMSGGPGPRPRFPNCETALKVSRDYVEAMKAFLPPNVKFAIQSSGSRAMMPHRDPDNATRALWDWDDALRSEPWFHAITWHTYPEIASSAGHIDILSGFGPTRARLPERFRSALLLKDDTDAQYALSALLATVESGTARQGAFFAKQFPDKEMWVTEWGVGENLAFYRGDRPVPTGLWVHVLARQAMAFLRVSAITVALNHSLYMDGPWSCIRREESERQYRPTGAYQVFQWINEAANGFGNEVEVTEIEVDGAMPVQGGHDGDTYKDLAAIQFENGNQCTLLLHNARGADVSISAAELKVGQPRNAEAIVTPSLRETYGFGTPPVRKVRVEGGKVTVPAYSLTRLVW